MASRPGRRTTIREPAEYTGLSPAAVSYALRGMQVSAETERRVREAAEKLVTRPIRLPARSRGARPPSWACSWAASPTSGTRSSCARWGESSTGGAQRLVADADGEPARELELAQRLLAQRVDGLVVVPIGPASGGWESIAREVATVTIGDALPGLSPAGEVVFDNERGVRASLEHLSALGHAASPCSRGR